MFTDYYVIFVYKLKPVLKQETGIKGKDVYFIKINNCTLGLFKHTLQSNLVHAALPVLDDEETKVTSCLD